MARSQKVLTRVQGATLITTEDGGEAWEKWSCSEIYDPQTDTTTVTGNSFNIHSGARGVVVQDWGNRAHTCRSRAVPIWGLRT